jgi:DNA-binding MarR family transcriptional regulator
MDRLGFTLKRAEQRLLAFQRALLKPLKPYGLTPARYLLLMVIWQSPWHQAGRGRWCMQREIVDQLGVTPATVSKMLKRMEEVGLVERERANRRPRGRKRMVFLTDLSRTLLRTVEREIIRPGVVWIAMTTVLARREKVGAVEYWLDEMRLRLFDTAQFIYPRTKRELFPDCKHEKPLPFAWPD